MITRKGAVIIALLLIGMLLWNWLVAVSYGG